MSIQKQFIWINIIGGLSVLGGYVYALLDHPILRGQIWGGVPENWQPWITMFMFISGRSIVNLVRDRPLGAQKGYIGACKGGKWNI